MTELKAHLSKLMRDQFGAPEQEQQAEARDVVAQLDALRARIPDALRQEPGQPIGGIASTLGVPIDLAQTLVRPLIGKDVDTRGVRRGLRYYAMGEAPPEESPDEGDDGELFTP
jgi:hypothetical protein